jgi:hypothetical protein
MAVPMAFPWPGVPALVTIGYAVVRLVLEMLRRSRMTRGLPPQDQDPGWRRTEGYERRMEGSYR